VPRGRIQEQAGEQQAAAAAAAFDTWWASRPAAEREALLARAKAELVGDNPVVAQHYQRHPGRMYEALRPLLQKLTDWTMEA
jgi:hypothetical protein